MADLDPSEYTVDELEDQIGEIDDPETLQEIREAEADGEDRTGALETIDEQLDVVSEEDDEDEASDAGGVSDQSAQTERDAGGEGTSLVYLDLEGLFVDLLGVEVDLNEVELDVAAVPGSGNLLGNLLSEVAGLLDAGPAGLLENLVEGLLDRLLPEEGFSGLLPEGGLSELLPEDGISEVLSEGEDLPSGSEMFYTVLNAVLDSLLDSLEERAESGSEGG